jgi:hypothetical protein
VSERAAAVFGLDADYHDREHDRDGQCHDGRSG